MYYEYWGLKQAPFDNVPDPRMYCNINKSIEDAITDVLFSIEEGNDCLAVIIGEVGFGKTLTLRLILDNIDPEKYHIAFITNPDMTFTQLLREILGQLLDKNITIDSQDHLLEEFNKVLFETANDGRHVVVFIDEANVIPEERLQSLRLLTNMQDDDKNLCTLVLAGQLELGQRLEIPALDNLFQRIGVYCRLEGLKTPEMVKEYLKFRLNKSGSKAEIFSDEAVQAIWRYSNRGVPRLVNKLAKLCLKESSKNKSVQVALNDVEDIQKKFNKTLSKFQNTSTEPAPAINISRQGLSEVAGEIKRKPVVVQQVKSSMVKEKEERRDIEPSIEVIYDLIKSLSKDILKKIPKMDQAEKLKVAGQLAAKQIKITDYVPPGDDPLIYWERLRRHIVTQLDKVRVKKSDAA